MSTTQRLLLPCLAVSGFSALVYEILWSRQLALVLGGDILAVSLVAATFMAGIALGSIAFGRRADRSSNPLRLYGHIEAGIGLSALLFPYSLELFSGMLLDGLSASSTPGLYPTLVSLGCIALLLVPSTLIGATLPVVCRLFAGPQFTNLIGLIYALNLGGALTGCLLTGFYLLPQLGLSLPNVLAATFNLGIASLAYMLSARPRGTAKGPDSSPRASVNPEQFFLCVLVGITGCVAMAYEILWTRFFIQFLGNTSYAFATVLGVFLLGLGLGAALYGYLARLILAPAKLLFGVCLVMAVLLAGTLPFYDQIAYLFEAARRWADLSWWTAMGCYFGLVSLLIIPPTLCSGVVFPAAMRLFSPEEQQTGRGTGLLLFSNTLGGVLGSGLVSLYLIETLGVHDGFRAVVALNLLAALLCLMFYRLRTCTSYGAPVILLVTVMLCWPTNWNPYLLTSGTYYYHYGEQGGLRSALKSFPDLIAFQEGREATVAVFEKADGHRYFRVNGKTDGGSDHDIATQVLLGQLPLLLHPEPTEALVIGLGTGITLAQVADSGLRVDCAEISPSVVTISDFFEQENRSVLKKSNVQLFVEDGRNLLLTRPHRYDIIISEPSNPWQTGNANLFTTEFYELAARRLTPSGLYCQWLPLYDLPTASVRSAIATFLVTFPDTLLFATGSDILLVGRRSAERAWSIPRTLSRTSRAALGSLDISTAREMIRTYFIAHAPTLQRFAANAPLNSDLHPQLEFVHQLGRYVADDNIAAINSARRSTQGQPAFHLR